MAQDEEDRVGQIEKMGKRKLKQLLRKAKAQRRAEERARAAPAPAAPAPAGAAPAAAAAAHSRPVGQWGGGLRLPADVDPPTPQPFPYDEVKAMLWAAGDTRQDSIGTVQYLVGDLQRWGSGLVLACCAGAAGAALTAAHAA